MTRLDSHYQRRLLDVVNNRLDNVCHSWFVPKQRRTVVSETAKLSDSTYQIVSQSKPGVLYAEMLKPRDHTGLEAKILALASAS